MGFNTDIIDDKTVSAYGKLVYFVLSKYANKDGTCWPSIKRIAGDAGISQNTVRRAMTELITAGWLVTEERKTVYGTNDTNLYILPRISDTSPQEGGTSQEGGGYFTTGNTPLPDVKTNLSNITYPINNISEEEKSILDYLPEINNYRLDAERDLRQVREWLKAYPADHVLNEIEKFNAWWRDNEVKYKGKKNFRSSITNWLKKSKVEAKPQLKLLT